MLESDLSANKVISLADMACKTFNLEDGSLVESDLQQLSFLFWDQRIEMEIRTVFSLVLWTRLRVQVDPIP